MGAVALTIAALSLPVQLEIGHHLVAYIEPRNSLLKRQVMNDLEVFNKKIEGNVKTHVIIMLTVTRL